MKYKFPALIVKEEDGFVVEFPDLEDAFTGRYLGGSV